MSCTRWSGVVARSAFGGRSAVTGNIIPGSLVMRHARRWRMGQHQEVNHVPAPESRLSSTNAPHDPLAMTIQDAVDALYHIAVTAS